MGRGKNEDVTGGKYGSGGGENNNIDPLPADAETKRERFQLPACHSLPYVEEARHKTSLVECYLNQMEWDDRSKESQ